MKFIGLITLACLLGLGMSIPVGAYRRSASYIQTIDLQC